MVRKYSVAVAGSAFEARTLRWCATRVSVMSVSGLEPHVYAGNRRWRGAISLGVAALALAGCAPPQAPRVSYSHGHEHFSQGKYGHASREGRRRWRTGASRRGAISGRPPLHGRGPPILPRREPLLYGDRHGLLVRRGVPWPPHRQRRSLRHGLAVGRSSDDAAAELCARDQSRATAIRSSCGSTIAVPITPGG